jgi:hypothetical protein
VLIGQFRESARAAGEALPTSPSANFWLPIGLPTLRGASHAIEPMHRTELQMPGALRPVRAAIADNADSRDGLPGQPEADASDLSPLLGLGQKLSEKGTK